MELSHPNIDQIAQNVLSVTPEQLSIQLSKMKGEPLQALIIAVNEHNESRWKEKIILIAKQTQDLTQIESIGHVLTPIQTLELLGNLAKWEDTKLTKLPMLIAGISPETFIEVLEKADLVHLQAFKKVAFFESLQHQLILVHHEIMRQLEVISKKFAALEQEIANLKPEEMGIKDRNTLEEEIFALALEQQKLLTCIDKALAIAWNSDRADIIDDFSNAKEGVQRSLLNYVGKPRVNGHLPTGLYSILEKRLFSIYGDPANPSDIHALKDTAPAIEALAHFSIWDLRDYFDIGLFPDIKTVSELELKSLDPEKLLEHRRALFLRAKEQLEKLGIGTVGDLKNKSIFSKKSLLEFLSM